MEIFLKSLGCKIQTQKIPTGSGSEKIETKFATLSVPLTFPEATVKQKKERR